MTKSKRKGITPKGHCFFCECLTEHAVGKIPICDLCGHDLLEFLERSREAVYKYQHIDEEEDDPG